ncbi:MAG: hypothetical protein V4673_13670 [Pseudomonadota bacterium]
MWAPLLHLLDDHCLFKKTAVIRALMAFNQMIIKKMRVKSMNETIVNGALLKSRLTMLVLTGAMFAAPAAHSEVVATCSRIDSCAVGKAKPSNASNLIVKGNCSLNGTLSWGVLRVKVGDSFSWREWRFDSAGAAVRFPPWMVNKASYVTIEVLCDYRHNQDPIATGKITFP